MLIFLYLLCIMTLTETAKILAVYPIPATSHQIVFRALTEELVKRGHEVVVITTDPAFPKDQAPANLTEIDVHDISYDFFREVLKDKKDINFEIGNESNLLPQLKIYQQIYRLIEVQLKCESVKELIRTRKDFDVLLIEAFVRSAMVYSYIFKVPVIQVSSFTAALENLESVGASTHPTLYPVPYRRRVYNLSLWEKIQQYYYQAQIIYYQQMNVRLIDKMLQEIFGPDIPSINELNKNVDMLFLNVHPIWMDNQPMPPNVIFMGGLHQKPIKELPKDLKLYLDSSKNGVVYVSFGTNVHPSTFPLERLKVLIEALSELPYDVLFRWTDELPGKIENIKTSKWLPQADLLTHPKVKAYVMQGGLQSTDEAIRAGVPLVCIPMLSDQWYNAEKYVHFKIGTKHDLTTLTKEELINAIESVIKDKSYRENIVKLREIMNDQPQTPLERAVWWVEYVVRHGGARHLRTPAANMSWAEYLELELVLVVLTVLLIIFSVSLCTIVSLWRIISQFRNSNDKIKRS